MFDSQYPTMNFHTCACINASVSLKAINVLAGCLKKFCLKARNLIETLHGFFSVSTKTYMSPDITKYTESNYIDCALKENFTVLENRIYVFT